MTAAIVAILVPMQLEEQTAMVPKLQSQLDMWVSMIRGPVSPDNIKLPPRIVTGAVLGAV